MNLYLNPLTSAIRILFFIAVVILSGCMSISGYDAKSSFACKAPDGILCESRSGIYANAMANNLPGQRVNRHQKNTDVATPLNEQSRKNGLRIEALDSGMPIRSQPRILRVWFAPWEDRAGDLHDQSHVYLTVDHGRWLIEHNHRRIQNAYQPIRAPENVRLLDSAEKIKNFPQLVGNAIETSPHVEVETISAVQSKPSKEEIAEFIQGIKTPFAQDKQ